MELKENNLINNGQFIDKSNAPSINEAIKEIKKLVKNKEIDKVYKVIDEYYLNGGKNRELESILGLENIPDEIPTQFAIGVTNICNLKCPLCITGLKQQQKALKYMDYELFTNIIDKIKDHAKLVQLYNWGESFLHKNIVDMIAYCSKFNLNTEISSNLSFKDDKKLEGAVENGLRRLIVSFDGTNQEDYSRYRVGGKFKLVLENIAKIRNHKTKYNTEYPKIILQFLRNKYTGNQIEEIKSNYKKWGADEYVVYDMTTIFKDRDLEKAKEWFDDKEIKTRKFLDVDIPSQGQYCYFINDFMIIEQDGSIAPCCYSTDPAENYGMWDPDKSLSENYNSYRIKAARKMFNEKISFDGHICNDCSVFLTYKDPSLKGKNYIPPKDKKDHEFISIIMPAYNRADMIGITLESFINQNYPADKYEIIIADNNSKDETKKVVEDWIEKSKVKITYLLERKQGVHYARNSAAKIAQGDILYFTDDDMIADRNLLKEIVKPFSEDPKIATATGRVLPKWDKEPPKWLLELCYNGWLSLNDQGEKEYSSKDDLGVWSCHQAIKKDIFFEAGGFNPENTDGEWIGDGETGLNLKIRDMGYKFAYNGKSLIYHMIPKKRMTQHYLNNRLSNQGNCDSYTEFRKHKYTDDQLRRKIEEHAINLINKLPEYLSNRQQNNIQWRMDLAKIHYFLNRIEYDHRIIEDPDWKELVKKNDWLVDDKI